MEIINQFITELRAIPRKHVLALYFCGVLDAALIVAALKLLKVL